MGSKASARKNAAATADQKQEPSKDEMSPPSPTLVERIEYWQAPLDNPVAKAAGGLHSFLAIWTHDLTVYLVEKLSDGEVYLEKVDSKNLRERTSVKGAVRFKLATESILRPRLKIVTIKRWAEEHEGAYDIHSNNCHLLATNLWNRAVEDSSRLEEIPQKKLSRLAEKMGMNTLIHKTVPAYAPTPEEKQQREEQRLQEVRAEARERIARAKRRQLERQQQQQQAEEEARRKNWLMPFSTTNNKKKSAQRR